MRKRIIILLVLGCFTSWAETKPAPSTNAAFAKPAQTPDAFKTAQRAEQVRLRCIQGRRYVAGRVLQVLPEGLIVDSGYSQLLSPPLNRSWLVNGTVSVHRDASAVEENKPDAVCVGSVLLSNFPKKPPVKAFDYVVMHAYPAGEYVYSPAPGIKKMVRRFSASLDRAVQANIDRESK